MKRAPVFTAAFAAAACAAMGAGAVRGEPPRIVHERLTCVPSDGNARVTAGVTAISPVVSARVYFRAVEKDRDYYFEMRRSDSGGYWAVLPVPESGTKGVQYKLIVKDADGLEGTTEPIIVPTKGDCPVVLSDEERRYAANLVVGLTSDGQKAIPEGFRCIGLVSKITVNGELRPNDDCKKVPAALWVAGGAAALLGGGAIIVNPGGGGPEPVVSGARPVPASSSP